jgi:hypothetical protein
MSGSVGTGTGCSIDIDGGSPYWSMGVGEGAREEIARGEGTMGTCCWRRTREEEYGVGSGELESRRGTPREEVHRGWGVWERSVCCSSSLGRSWCSTLGNECEWRSGGGARSVVGWGGSISSETRAYFVAESSGTRFGEVRGAGRLDDWDLTTSTVRVEGTAWL